MFSLLCFSSHLSPCPAIVFPQQLLDLVEGFSRAILGAAAVHRIDASTRSRSRHEAIQAFKQPSSPIKLFLMTVRSCGLGTDLPRIDAVVLFDSDWHPQLDIQVIFGHLGSVFVTPEHAFPYIAIQCPMHL